MFYLPWNFQKSRVINCKLNNEHYFETRNVFWIPTIVMCLRSKKLLNKLS